MSGETHLLVEIYLVYIITMTVLVSYLLYLSLVRKEERAYLFLELSFIMTAVFFVLMSHSLIISLLIAVYLWLIPRLIHSFGKLSIASITSTLSHEILMSLLYYTIVRGNLLSALYSLYFYATDIPSFSLSIYQIIIPSILEIVNSFMFFLMIFPEIAYVCVKSRNYYALAISLLALSGPNIASEMTHSILPLQEDPIKQASILVLLLSLSLQLLFTFEYARGRISNRYFLTFLLVSTILSLSDLYYSLTINEVPYAIATLISLFISLYIASKPIQRGGNVNSFLLLASAFPNLFWGASVAEFFNLYQLLPLFSLIPFTLGVFPFFYLKFNKN